MINNGMCLVLLTPSLLDRKMAPLLSKYTLICRYTLNSINFRQCSMMIMTFLGLKWKYTLPQLINLPQLFFPYIPNLSGFRLFGSPNQIHVYGLRISWPVTINLGVQNHLIFYFMEFYSKIFSFSNIIYNS